MPESAVLSPVWVKSVPRASGSVPKVALPPMVNDTCMPECVVSVVDTVTVTSPALSVTSVAAAAKLTSGSTVTVTM